MEKPITGGLKIWSSSGKYVLLEEENAGVVLYPLSEISVETYRHWQWRAQDKPSSIKVEETTGAELCRRLRGSSND